MTELLTMMATPAWAYLALFGFLTVDAMIPVVPIQAIMITSGALTVYGNLNLALVIAVGALGMFTGDSIAFVLGRSTGQVGRGWLSGKICEWRARYGPKHDDDQDKEDSRTRRAAERFTRGLRRPGPLVLLLCRFVPGGRMAAGFHAGRTGYPIKLFILYDGAAAIAWATYGGLVGHVGGTAITQSAWRLFAIAATAAVVFGTAGWILALFGGRKDDDLTLAAVEDRSDPARQTGRTRPSGQDERSGRNEESSRKGQSGRDEQSARKGQSARIDQSGSEARNSSEEPAREQTGRDQQATIQPVGAQQAVGVQQTAGREQPTGQDRPAHPAKQPGRTIGDKQTVGAPWTGYGRRPDEQTREAYQAGAADVTEARATSADEPLPRSTPTRTGR